MNKQQQEAASEQYRNKFVFNQRGGSIEIDNTTGQESIYFTQYTGNNIKITPQVISEYATNNKQTLVTNDSFETVRNDKCVFVGGDYVYRVIGNHSVHSGYTDDSQLEALKEWKEAYRPVAERNSQFEIQRGGESFPNGVVTPEVGERSENPSKNQEKYITDDVYGQITGVSIVTSEEDQVTGYSNINMPGPVFNVVNPNTEDFGEDINPATEAGIFEPTPERQPEDFLRDVPRLQREKLTELEGKFGGGVSNKGGDDQDFTFRNKVIMVGGEVNDYPSIRTVPDGRATPSRVIVGPQAGAFVEIGAVPHVEEVNNSYFPVGNYSIHAGNRYTINSGSGGVDIKTSGPVEVGGTTYKLAANKVNIQSSAGVNITSENLVELTSLKNISLRSNKQVLVEPGLGVKNNVIIGGSTYTEGETYLHHVTAPTEIQQTENTALFGKLLKGLQFKAKVSGFSTFEEWVTGSTTATFTLEEDSNSDLVELPPHSHHFKNLPLRLTDSSKSVRTIAIGENINTDGFQTPAQNVAHELKQPTSEPTQPRELAPAEGTLLPHDRDRVEFDGTIKPEFPQLEKQGIFAQEAPVDNQGIAVLEGQGDDQ
tara:strand:+ start:1232 stop:3022 length:1791 start_codon:yes stop_codon:yes gene_type:complete